MHWSWAIHEKFARVRDKLHTFTCTVCESRDSRASISRLRENWHAMPEYVFGESADELRFASETFRNSVQGLAFAKPVENFVDIYSL